MAGYFMRRCTLAPVLSMIYGVEVVTKAGVTNIVPVVNSGRFSETMALPGPVSFPTTGGFFYSFSWSKYPRVDLSGSSFDLLR